MPNAVLPSLPKGARAPLDARLGISAPHDLPHDVEMMTLASLPVPVEKTEEGADYPPIVDYQPGLPGRKNAPPNGSTAELFREYQHFGLRRTWAQPPTGKFGPSIMLPKSCEVISQDNIVVDRPLADCGNSKVLQVKLRINGSTATRTLTRGPNVQFLPCVARLVREPTRQFWREVGVWSSLRHENIVQFVGVCISAQGAHLRRAAPRGGSPLTTQRLPSPTRSLDGLRSRRSAQHLCAFSRGQRLRRQCQVARL